MNSSRLIAASGIIAVAIIIGFALSIPHARDGGHATVGQTTAATTTPTVTYRDSYQRGVHTITGSILAPNPCTLVTATATPELTGASTTAILLALTIPKDTGVCLEEPSHVTFSAKLIAPRDLPISAMVNGAMASTSTSTNPA